MTPLRFVVMVEYPDDGIMYVCAMLTEDGQTSWGCCREAALAWRFDKLGDAQEAWKTTVQSTGPAKKWVSFVAVNA